MLKRYATPMYNESPLPHGTMNTFAYDGISDYTDKEFEGAVNWQHGFFLRYTDEQGNDNEIWNK